MGYPVLNSFNNVPITQKSLILCDIDDTLLTNKFVKFTANKNNNLVINLPKYTDKDGFTNLLQKLQKTNSKLYFVTARNIKYIEFTRRQFKILGIDIDKYPVYFCGDIPKGIIIKKFINMTNYKNIIFIDDLKYNLDNVKKELGNRIKCILFQK